jgi:hypothetical protein
VEIVRAAIRVEGPEQPPLGNRLGEPQKARHRALLRHQDCRGDRARRIVQRDDEIKVMVEGADPAMRRAVLKQQHAGQPPPLAPLAVGAAAPRVRQDEPGALQRPPGHRVRELGVVPRLPVLVTILDRAVAGALLVENLHARQLGRRRPPRRDFAETAVAQAVGAVLLIA